jgi:Holliday junction resolvase RusA-like endonuclease
MIEQSKHVGAYRDAVAKAARIEYGDQLITGPVETCIIFHFKRPKKHYRADGTLRPDAPTGYAYGCQRGDLDKLVRAVHDALTGTVYVDDAQIVVTSSIAVFNDEDATFITVIPKTSRKAA